MGHSDAVRALAEHGADVNAVNHENVTPIYVAAMEGITDVVRALAELGADVSSLNGDAGSLPLHTAAHSGFTSIIRVLAEHGADVNAKDCAPNATTPVLSARRRLN